MANLVIWILFALAGSGYCSLPRNDRPTGDDAALKKFMMKNNRLPLPNESISEIDQPGANSWTTCEGCKLLVTEAAKIIKNPQEIANLKTLLGRVCELPILVRRKNECENMVNNIIVVLHQLEPILDNPTAVCEELKYCPESIRGDITAQQRVLLLLGLKALELAQPGVTYSATCDECIFAVSELSTLIQSQSIQAKVKQELHSICRMAGQYESECDAMIDQYFDLLIQQVVQMLSNGRQVCTDIGLCSGKKAPASRTSGVIHLRPVHARIGRVNLRPYYPTTSKLDIFLSSLQRIQTRQGINAGCLVCQAAFKAAMDAMSQEQTATMITTDLTNFVCGLVPPDMKMGCKDFMSIYSRAFLQLVVSEYTPSQLCSAIHVCKPDDNRRIEELSVGAKSAAVCDACQVVSQYLSFEIQQQDFQTEIINVLKRACSILPGDYATQCDNSLVTYVPSALRFTADYLSRDVLCAMHRDDGSSLSETVLRPARRRKEGLLPTDAPANRIDFLSSEVYPQQAVAFTHLRCVNGDDNVRLVSLESIQLTVSIMEILRCKFKDKVKSIGSTSVMTKSKCPRVDPDEKWSQLYRERHRNHLYKWADGTGGGELLTLYDNEGEEGVQRFASEVLPTWLYNDGIIPEELKQEEYIKWRKYMHANLTGGHDISTADILDSIGGHFNGHSALWKLTKRGIDGETLIHLLLSKDDAKYTEIAIVIINVYPALAADIYESDEFYGQSPLHLAITHDDFECVRLIVECGADINQRATGKFFLPEDQKRTPKAKYTNYAGFAYYGEYPLAFAASFGNKDIYDYLIENGADPNSQDSFGDTVLHMCVINNSIEMYSYAVRHWSKPADVNICNNAGYTPLTLATILGRREIFEAMLELTKVEFWRFSDITYSAYPLTTLDTIRSDGSTNWESALMRVVNGTTTSHLEIVGGEVIQRLLADKWRLFGEVINVPPPSSGLLQFVAMRCFSPKVTVTGWTMGTVNGVLRKMYDRLVFQVFHILCLSVAVYTRSSSEPSSLLALVTAGDFVRFAAEAATVVSCLFYLLYQQSSEIRAQGVNTYVRSMIQAPEKPIFLAANISILACVPCRILKMHLEEETFLVLGLPGFWLSLLFYAKGFLMTGPFVVMIYSMVAGDMVRFGILSLIFLVSFSQGFYFLGKDISEKQALQYGCEYNDTLITDYESYLETALTLFRMSLGGYDYEKIYCAAYQPLAKILFILFMIVWPIMLINMLIAMMGSTYERIIAHAEKAWRQQWAQIVILLERSLDKKKLAKLQGEYSININEDRFDDNNEGDCVRALMVIKQTKQTRARQRKKATASWKRLGRKVFSMFRTHGVDNTKRAMHNRVTVVTDSRPPSAGGDILHLTHGHLSNGRRSLASATPIRGLQSRLEEPQTKVGRVLDTVRSNSVAPPLLNVPAGGYESPKFMVHHQSSADSRSRTPLALDKNTLIRKLSVLELEPKQQELPQIPTHAVSLTGDATAAVVEGMPAAPLSSPCSLSETGTDRTLFEQVEQAASDFSIPPSSNPIQLHPMNTDYLPPRPRTGGQAGRGVRKNRRILSASIGARSVTESALPSTNAGASGRKPVSAARHAAANQRDGQIEDKNVGAVAAESRRERSGTQ